MPNGTGAQVAACLTGLDTGRPERALVWWGLDHDRLFDMPGVPSMAVRDIYEVAARAPLESQRSSRRRRAWRHWTASTPSR
ncbi:hypothetical protein AB0I77_03210 [Streptomyces sp. NPDC050619]|uniref:hypothetical protein n=1 Tax=Streptomyces sp. NPDC050619 TaxID=3157214 RepID=UPI003438EE39